MESTGTENKISPCPCCKRNPMDPSPRNKIRELVKKYGCTGELCNPGGRELHFPFGKVQLSDQCVWCDYETLHKAIVEHLLNSTLIGRVRELNKALRKFRDAVVKAAKINFKWPTCLKGKCGDCLFWTKPLGGWGYGHCSHMSGPGVSMPKGCCNHWKERSGYGDN